jgi:SAM-dependent methyltransferase
LESVTNDPRAEDIRQLFARSVKEDSEWTSIERVVWRLQDTLRYVDWQGKDVLEIGCGDGTMACYMAMNGARQVVGIDPVGDGGTQSDADVLHKRVETLGIENLTFHPVAIDGLEYEANSFDAILGIQVVEHIHESTIPLHENPTGLEAYKNAFSRLRELTRPGGALVLTDCSRYSIWSFVKKFGIPPLVPGNSTVHWEIHQTPGIYRRLALEAGFDKVRVHWRVPYQLRAVPWIADNAVFQYFTWASYILTAHKQA